MLPLSLPSHNPPNLADIAPSPLSLPLPPPHALSQHTSSTLPHPSTSSPPRRPLLHGSSCASKYAKTIRSRACHHQFAPPVHDKSSRDQFAPPVRHVSFSPRFVSPVRATNSQKPFSMPGGTQRHTQSRLPPVRAPSSSPALSPIAPVPSFLAMKLSFPPTHTRTPSSPPPQTNSHTSTPPSRCVQIGFVRKRTRAPSPPACGGTSPYNLPASLQAAPPNIREHTRT